MSELDERDQIELGEIAITKRNGFNARSVTMLHKHGFMRVKDFIDLPICHLVRLRGIGYKTINNVLNAIGIYQTHVNWQRTFREVQSENLDEFIRIMRRLKKIEDSEAPATNGLA